MDSSPPLPIEPSADVEPALRLAGEQVVFLGKLVGMTRREACELVRQHGGTVSNHAEADFTLAIIGDNQPDLASSLQADKVSHQRLAGEIAAGRTQLLHESELWERLGLVGCESAEQGVQRLYTPAMLAELLDVSVAAIRRWHRGGSLVACRSVRRLPYFDFAEVAVARHLATLYNAGCSLTVIDRKLAELQRSMPEVSRPLCDPAVTVSGHQLILRRGDDLTDPGGQLLIDFDKPVAEDEEPAEVILSWADGLQQVEEPAQETLSTFEQLQLEALKWEDQGELSRAAETYRTLLMASGPTPEVHFSLGDLLYRMGDLSAARERFFAAIELDEEYVEARSSLGCVLAESGDFDLAISAFEGALAYHPDYADVHYHLANALDRQQRNAEAMLHWQNFLALAPESPWAEMARTRLKPSDETPSVVVTS